MLNELKVDSSYYAWRYRWLINVLQVFRCDNDDIIGLVLKFMHYVRNLCKLLLRFLPWCDKRYSSLCSVSGNIFHASMPWMYYP